MAQDRGVNPKNFLRRAKAAQRLQSCGGVRRRRMGSGSGPRAGTAGFLCSELGHSTACRAHHTGSAGCARFGVGIRANAGGNQAHRRQLMRSRSGCDSKKRAWIYVVVVGAVVSIGLFFLGRYSAAPTQHCSGRHFGRSRSRFCRLKI